MLRKLRSLLSLAGLREEEIQVYLLLLKLRKATMPELQAQSELSNISVYRTVQRLVEQELIEAKPINGKQYVYQSLSLQALTRKIAVEQRKLRRLELALKDLDPLLPYLELEDNEEEDIEVCTGKDAFREEYLKIPDILEEEYMHIGSLANMWKVGGFTYECPEERGFINRRLKKNLFARVLNPWSEESEMVQQNDSREKRTLILTEKVPVLKDFLQIGEKQVSHFVCDADNPRVIVIRNPELVALHHTQFESLWKKHK